MDGHRLDAADRRFRSEFEAGRLAPGDFGHRAHVRLAYVYLAEFDDGAALERMRAALQGFLRRHGIESGKYHETMTRAWLLAVRHFMESSPPSGSAGEFIERNATLLDPAIMETHYSADLLFSDMARAEFVDPDREDIPRYRPGGA